MTAAEHAALWISELRDSLSPPENRSRQRVCDNVAIDERDAWGEWVGPATVRDRTSLVERRYLPLLRAPADPESARFRKKKRTPYTTSLTASDRDLPSTHTPVPSGEDRP